MNHACEDCGKTFDTLTALRSHACPVPPADGFDVAVVTSAMTGWVSVPFVGTCEPGSTAAP